MNKPKLESIFDKALQAEENLKINDLKNQVMFLKAKMKKNAADHRKALKKIEDEFYSLKIKSKNQPLKKNEKLQLEKLKNKYSNVSRDFENLKKKHVIFKNKLTAKCTDFDRVMGQPKKDHGENYYQKMVYYLDKVW